jgi:hypothetical protein
VFFCSETSPDPSVSELVSGMLRASSKPDKVRVPVGDPKSNPYPIISCTGIPEKETL